MNEVKFLSADWWLRYFGVCIKITNRNSPSETTLQDCDVFGKNKLNSNDICKINKIIDKASKTQRLIQRCRQWTYK